MVVVETPNYNHIISHFKQISILTPFITHLPPTKYLVALNFIIYWLHKQHVNMPILIIKIQTTEKYMFSFPSLPDPSPFFQK